MAGGYALFDLAVIAGKGAIARRSVVDIQGHACITLTRISRRNARGTDWKAWCGISEIDVEIMIPRRQEQSRDGCPCGSQ